jgi:hypothetical protein
MEIHSTTVTRKHALIDVLAVSPATLLLVPPDLCVDLFDTAPPPHDLFAGVLDTALLPPNRRRFS